MQVLQKKLLSWLVIFLKMPYSGFLGSPRQIDIISKFILDFKSETNLVVVDGILYKTMADEMVVKMRELIRGTDIRVIKDGT